MGPEYWGRTDGPTIGWWPTNSTSTQPWYTNGEDGVGVELVRIHRRDALSRPGVEVAENNDGSLLHEYEFDVVIDRTGGQLGGDLHATLNDGVDDDGDGVPDRWGHQVEIHNDEFYDAVSFLLPADGCRICTTCTVEPCRGSVALEYDDGSGSWAVASVARVQDARRSSRRIIGTRSRTVCGSPAA